jgi:structural maintenance of chromosome 2
MSFVFGDTFVCDDAATAKLVTFSPEIGGARSVTLEGDVYDPSGSLSGGAAPTGSGVLLKVQELLEVEGRYMEAYENLKGVEATATPANGSRERWRSMNSELEIKEHEVKLLTEQVEGSNAARVSSVVRMTLLLADVGTISI